MGCVELDVPIIYMVGLGINLLDVAIVIMKALEFAKGLPRLFYGS